MCKFTHRLFEFALLLLLQLEWAVEATPSLAHKPDGRLFDDFIDQDYDYDLHYDQRQKGNENLHLKLDGFLVGLPAQEQSGLLVLTDDLLENLGEELLLGFGKSHSSSSTRAPDHDHSSERIELESSTQKTSKAAESVIVKLPEQKRVPEARGVEGSGDDSKPGSRSKMHIIQLLNFLRGRKKV